MIERDDAADPVEGEPRPAARAEAAGARPRPGPLRSRRALAWSLALNAVLVGAIGIGVARRLARPAQHPDAMRRMRVDHLRELAARSAAAEVVMLGDSLVQHAEWSELMGRPVANRGVAGDRVEQVRQRLADVAALRPRVLFLLVGVNDLGEGAAPEEVARRYAALLGELRAALPTTRLVAQALLPVRGQRRVTPSAISETNALLARAAEAQGAAWVDAGKALADPTGQLDPRYSLDGLHLTGAGYRAWADALRPLLTP